MIQDRSVVVAWAMIGLGVLLFGIIMWVLIPGCATRGGPGDPCSYNPDCQPGLFCDSGACSEFQDGTDAGSGSDSGTDAATGTDSGSDATTTDSTPALGPCGGNQALYVETMYLGRCYRLPLTDVATWDEAATRCTDLGAGWHLATVADDPESTAAYGVLATTSISSAWLGLDSNGTDCTFSWITGEVVSWEPWGMAQPDNCVGTRSCGHYWSGPVLGDAPCDGTMTYLCEME